ncbi:MAG: EAL domain-containing protein [Hahellaceae bacterium]|nr:EAL domain-containing protein [Hahellaceae bacterium]MCP5168340.1 EAL domain-containing protein [Hahellaceae bacterium]
MIRYQIARTRNDAANGKVSDQAWILATEQNQIIRISSIAERWFGYRNQDIAGKPLKTLMASSMDCPQPLQADLPEHKPDATTFRNAEGNFFTGMLSFERLHDLPEALPDNEPQKPVAAEPVNDNNVFSQMKGLGGWQLDIATLQVQLSEGASKIFGLPPQSQPSAEHILYFFSDRQQRLSAMVRRALEKGIAFELELPIITNTQESRWVRVSGQPEIKQSKVTALKGTILDITPFRQSSEESNYLTECLNGILEGSQDIIAALDNELKVIVCNQVGREEFASLFGIEVNRGDYLPDLLKNHTNERLIYMRLWERAFEKESFHVEMPLAQRDTDLPVWDIQFTRIDGRQGECLGAALIARRLSDHANPQETLNYLARHDPLTGLFNRKEFASRLNRCMEQAEQRGSEHSLLYMDLDNYQSINERYGDKFGDELLKQLGQLIKSKIRQRDALARIGGDAFAAILENCSGAEALKVAFTVRDTLADYHPKQGSQSLDISVSIGLVPITTDCQPSPESHKSAADMLLDIGHNTCYAAKALGRSRVNCYQPDGENRANELGEYRRAIDLIHDVLIDVSRLSLDFQQIRPIHSAVWGEHFEILTRLEDKEQGRIRPEHFLPIAERFDLARELDRKIIDTVFAWLVAHPLQAHRRKLCSINLTLNSLQDETFSDYIENRCDFYQLPPELFCFEFDERAILKDLEMAHRQFTRLKAVGCKLAIDKVGTGDSNFLYLSELPADFIKIDGRMIAAMSEDKVTLIFVESLHKIAQATGKQTIACDIENHHILSTIRQMGLHFGQGMGISPPKPLEDMLEV